MRLALLLRTRRRLLMQLDPTLSGPSSSSPPPSSLLSRLEPRPGIKRTYSQQATQLRPSTSSQTFAPPPAKMSRRNDNSHPSSPFSDARQGTSTSMPPPSNKNRQRNGGTVEAGPSSSSRRGPPPRKGKQKQKPKNILSGPYHDEKNIEEEHNKSLTPLTFVQKSAPKSHLNNLVSSICGEVPEYHSVSGSVQDGSRFINVWRTTVLLDLEPQIMGIGDHPEKKESVALAALSAIYQLRVLELSDPSKLGVRKNVPTETILSDGTVLKLEEARSFMDYYCRRFSFEYPDIEYINTKRGWEAIMSVGGRKIGMGKALNKRQSLTSCYLDVTKYLESCDPALWKDYVEAAKTGKNLGLAPKIYFQSSYDLGETIGDVCYDIRKTKLYLNRPSPNAIAVPGVDDTKYRDQRRSTPAQVQARSKILSERRQRYLADPAMEKMRQTRMTLPVYTRAKEVLTHIENNEVTICMAATGSGKTTQIPQMILDDYIDRNEGAKCHIVCTQPRRLAAISVADRIAKERGESLGQSLGYQVRFDAKLPEQGGGSITFCTTGIFLKRLQTMLGHGDGGQGFDEITHVIVDEVHERDIDTDLLLVVLKQIMARKKAKNQQFKVILMSATIDPTLFQEYFKDDAGVPANVISIPGRSFPVTKYFLDDFVPKLLAGPMQWITEQESVAQYLFRELGLPQATRLGLRTPNNENRSDELDLPYPLIAATIAHVIQNSDDGHVLVFLPGWEDMVATQKALLSPVGFLPIKFNSSEYSLHMLHSTIPVQEQQAVFEPPPAGVRRIILATNIAETSITIPDVVYVIDSAKIKEQRYDPDKHMSSLVSAWVGSSNLNQRAGRAGRHRSGEYFGILGKAHAESLHPHQTVEMKRSDLSNVVMHVKALNLPGMTVEDVLSAAIEAPDPGRVESAMKSLQMVGALDSMKNLTSLGKVLLQIPVDAQMGRLVLYGCFFRCLDPALTLAAILSNRDPFMSPMHLKDQARHVKASWVTDGFNSDPLAVLKAFDKWWSMQSRGEYISANRFCVDNFLSKPTLLMIQKIKSQLLQSLYRAGVVEVSAGGSLSNMNMNTSARVLTVPPALNANKDSYPLLTALIAIASQPKFGIRAGERAYRTSFEKAAIIHPSSVNHTRRSDPPLESNNASAPPRNEKQLYAFTEKRKNDTVVGGQIYLVGTTRLDPLTYILFGAYQVDVVEQGLVCDDWLPIFGDVRVLDDIQRLKKSMEACMLRVFEGIMMSRQRGAQALPIVPREEAEEHEFETGDDADGMKDYALSSQELQELDLMTRDITGLLNRASDERLASASRQTSRAPTPFGSPHPFFPKLPGGGDSVSGYSTPSNHYFNSRPGTPSRFRR